MGWEGWLAMMRKSGDLPSNVELNRGGASWTEALMAHPLRNCIVDCSAFLTPEERYLMDAFTSTIEGHSTRARMNAMLLCEGKDPTSFLNAARNLGVTSGPIAHRMDNVYAI